MMALINPFVFSSLIEQDPDMIFLFPKIGGEICEAIENALEEAVAIPMDEGHKANTFGPLHPIRVVDETNKVHQNLTEDWLGLITGADGRDHRIHVDTETREVSDIYHGTDTGDGRLAS